MRTRIHRGFVLADGVFRNRDRAFHARLETGVQALAPGARLVRLTLPPVVGAAGRLRVEAARLGTPSRAGT